MGGVEYLKALKANLTSERFAILTHLLLLSTLNRVNHTKQLISFSSFKIIEVFASTIIFVVNKSKSEQPDGNIKKNERTLPIDERQNTLKTSSLSKFRICKRVFLK